MDNFVKLFNVTRLILLDYSSIYKSKKSKGVVLKANSNTLYLSVYFPDFAPIETRFSILKQKIVKEWKNQIWKLNFDDSYYTEAWAPKNLKSKAQACFLEDEYKR